MGDVKPGTDVIQRATIYEKVGMFEEWKRSKEREDDYWRAEHSKEHERIKEDIAGVKKDVIIIGNDLNDLRTVVDKFIFKSMFIVIALFVQQALLPPRYGVEFFKWLASICK